jgi:hypothetical protein
LRQKIELVLPELAGAFRELTSHPRFRELYVDFLVATHQGMRASVPLLRTAAERCRKLAPTDRVAAALVPYYEQHVKEEDHDWWSLEDLEVLGVSRAEVWRRIPSPTVVALFGSQYYWVLHYHPVAMLGDMMAREGYVPPPEVVDRLMELTGHPRSAFRNLERHSHIDKSHRADLIRLIDSLPLEPDHHTAMGLNAMQTVHLMAQLFRELAEQSGAG